MGGFFLPLRSLCSVHERNVEDAAGGARAERLVGAAQLVVFIAPTSAGMPSSRAMSSTVSRVMPSSTFVAGVLQDPVAYDEALKLHALGDEALPVGESATVFATAGVVNREQRALEIEPVVVLDARVDRRGSSALGIADHEAQAALALFRGGQPDVGDGEAVEAVDAQPDVARAPVGACPASRWSRRRRRLSRPPRRTASASAPGSDPRDRPAR